MAGPGEAADAPPADTRRMPQTTTYPAPPTISHVVTDAVAAAGAISLPVIERGDPAGVPVVFIAGLSDSGRSYEYVLQHLPDSIRAIAVTLRGHGDAPKPEYGYSIQQLAADVRRTLDDAGVVRAVIAGHSLGSIVASRVAIDHPQRVAGVVLMGGFARSLDDIAEAVAALEDPVDPGFVREFQESTLARPIPEGMLDDVVDESLKLPAHAWNALAAPLRVNHAPSLRRMYSPAMLAWGDQDAIGTRADQAALLDAIPDSRLVVYPGGGHAFHWEDPAAFAGDLVAFVDEHVRRI
jgi:non-heme chloroperoxidase